MSDQINRSSESGQELDHDWKELPEKPLDSSDWFTQVSVVDEGE